MRLPDRVAVTGGTGFIGGHLVRALVSQGHEPLLLARAARQTALLDGVSDRVRWADADLQHGDDVETVLRAERPQVLFHLAGTRGAGSPSLAVSCADVNVQGTVHLLHAAARAGVERVVLVGSAAEYGAHPGAQHEDLPLRPTAPYGISKAAATQFALAMQAAGGCPVVVLRPFTVYGPGQPADMFIADAVRRSVRGEPFAMSAGLQRRDFVYVDDVVAALLAAGGAPGAEGQVINVGSGVARALRDVAQLIWQLTGTDAPLQVGARPAAAHDLYDTWADTARAKTLLDWTPQVDLPTGLAHTIGWTRAQELDQVGKCQSR